MGDPWDVIVVGGGPAGAAAARAATEAGARTLVVEAARPPRRKACAGVLPAAALARVEDAFAVTVPRAALAPSSLIGSLRLHLAPDVALGEPLDWPAVRVLRRPFDALLLDAVRPRASVREGAAVLAVEEERGDVVVKLEGELSLRARAVVVAAGAGTQLAPRGLSLRLGLCFSGRGVHPSRTLAPLGGAPPGRQLLLLAGGKHDGLSVIDPEPDGVSITTTVKDPRRWKAAHIRAVLHATGPLGLALGRERAAEYGWAAQGEPILGRGRVLLAGDAGQHATALGLGLEGAVESGLAAGAAAAAVASGAADGVAELRARLAPWLAARSAERGAAALLRGQVAGLGSGGGATGLAQALSAGGFGQRVTAGKRLLEVVRALEAQAPPPTGWGVFLR